MSTATLNIKTCSTCGLTLPVGDFPRRTESRDGHRGRCKRCDARYMREYRRRRRGKTLDKFAGDLARQRDLTRVRHYHR